MFAFALTSTVAGMVARVFLECWRGVSLTKGQIDFANMILSACYKLSIMVLFLLKHRRICFISTFVCHFRIMSTLYYISNALFS